MNKTEYMNKLKQELNGLPAAVIEDTLWSYEAKFVDAMLAGRDEHEIAASLPPAHLVAAQKRAALRYQGLKENIRPTNLAGLLVALMGVLLFNFLMLIPAILYSVILFSAYLGAFAMYVAGIVITAASLAGTPQINFDLATPRNMTQFEDLAELDIHRRNSVKVDISSNGIIVDELNLEPDADYVTEDASKNEQENQENSVLHVSVGNHLNQAQLLHGIGWLLAGISLCMLCLLMTRISLIGFKNYLRWNLSLLQLPKTV
jgi:uncharacterized membrane protein